MAQHKTASKSGGKSRVSTRSAKKNSSAPAARRGKAQRGNATPIAAGDADVLIDRRRGADRRDVKSPDPTSSAAPPLERRKKVNRRRQIDPTTCERDYTEDEVEFMNALDDYKRKSGRMFPTCSEVLEVIRGLGYLKIPAAEFEAAREVAVSGSAKPMPTDWNSIAAPAEQFTENGLTSSPEPYTAF